MKKLIVVGATGKMGRMICDLVKSDSKYQDKFELVRSVSRVDSSDLDYLKKNVVDVIIDFSRPENALSLAPVLKNKADTFYLLCTTGFQDSELDIISSHLKNNKWKWVTNTSLGVAALNEALRVASKILNTPIFNVSIKEIHHIHKKDAPSGTAVTLRQTIQNNSNHLISHVDSIREGEVVGFHQVVFQNSLEKIVFSHEAFDRSVFAHGALQMAQNLVFAIISK